MILEVCSQMWIHHIIRSQRRHEETTGNLILHCSKTVRSLALSRWCDRLIGYCAGRNTARTGQPPGSWQPTLSKCPAQVFLKVPSQQFIKHQIIRYTSPFLPVMHFGPEGVAEKFRCTHALPEKHAYL